MEFARIHNAAIIATPQGKGLVNSYHPQFKGVFGVGGHESAIQSLRDPSIDLILAVGTGLDQAATNGWDESSIMNSKLVHIDSNIEHFTRSQIARLHVKGDILSIFEILVMENANNKTNIIILEEAHNLLLKKSNQHLTQLFFLIFSILYMCLLYDNTPP